MTRPLPAFSTLFCLGIIIAKFISFSFAMAYIAALVILCALIILPPGRAITKFIACFFILLLGATCYRQWQILPRDHISRSVYFDKNEFYAVEGFVESEPKKEDDKATFVIALKRFQDERTIQQCCGRLLVCLENRKDVHYGKLVHLVGRISHLPNFKDQGGRLGNYRDYLHNQGIYGVMHPMIVKEAAGQFHPGYLIKGLTLSFKQKIEKVIFEHASSLTAAVLDAMILGEKKYIPPLLYQSMINTGTIHILVVSGFNVGIVAFIAMLFLKIIRLPRSLRYFISILAVIIYCLMTGASNPVVRATVMALTFTIAQLIDREPDIYNSCALAVLFILAISPNQLFDIGFQLSFASVISIIYIYPRISQLLRVEAIKIRLFRLIADGFLVSLSAWLGTGGFIFYYFKIICPITVLANILIVPLATLVTLCGIALIAVSSVSPSLALAFAPACELTVTVLLKTNAIFASVPPLM